MNAHQKSSRKVALLEKIYQIRLLVKTLDPDQQETIAAALQDSAARIRGIDTTPTLMQRFVGPAASTPSQQDS